MAIDRTGITSLETGAPDIKYTGDEGPKSPATEQMKMAGMMSEIAADFEIEHGYDMAVANPEMREAFIREWLKNNFHNKTDIPFANGGSANPTQEQQIAAQDYSSSEYRMSLIEKLMEQGLDFGAASNEADRLIKLMLERKGSAEGGIARLGYKNGEMVTVPKHWQSAPDHPKTELAYITKAEKDLLVKKDLHNSLKDGPNKGPGGVMSLNGTYGGEYRTGEEVSAAERGDKDAFGTSEANQKAAEEARAGFIAAGGNQGSTKGESEGVKKQVKEIKEDFPEEKFGIKTPLMWALEQAKKFKAWNNAMQRKNFKEWYQKKNPAPFFAQTGKGFVWDDWTDEDWLEKDIGEIPGYREYLDRFQHTGGGGGDAPGRQDLYIPPFEASVDKPVDPVTGFPTDPIRFASGISPVHDFTGIYGQRTIPVKDGGRIGYAGGGIADLRQGYFLGKLVKKIGKGVKKVLKSPIGKAALIGGLGAWGLKGLGGGGWNPMNLLSKGSLGFMRKGAASNEFLKSLLMKGDKFSPWKLGIMGMSAYPLVAGMGDDDDEESDLYKRWLAQKQGWDQTFAPVGDEANWQRKYLYADGGRIGYRNGNDVDPDNPLHEGEPLIIPDDADISPDDFWAKRNKPSGIMMASNDTLFEALELSFKQYKEAGGIMSRQEYFLEFLKKNPEAFKPTKMAKGGRIGYDIGGSASDRYEAKIKELMDKGMSREMAEALVISELSPDAHRILEKDGGRIGYAKGGNDDEEDHRSVALSAMYGLRKNAQEGGLMDLGGMEKDYRNEGGFVPIGGQERADDVPARLSKNEFVFTADAVRNAGGGDIDKGAEIMENLMENLEKGGKVSEESQGLEGARNMFATSQRLEGVL